jgi:signal transduction histidine kinase
MNFIRTKMLDLGLWSRVALAVSLGFMALFAAFAALGEWALYNSTTRLLDKRLVIAEMMASQIDWLVLEAISELEEARRFADFDPADPDLLDEADVLAQTYGRGDIFAPGLTFFDPSGKVYVSHPANLYPSGTDLSALPQIAEALTARSVTISEAFHDPLNNRPVALVTVPVYDGDYLLGFLSGLIDLGDQAVLAPLLQSATLGRTGRAALVDREGRTLASTLSLSFLSPGEHATFYRQAMAEGQPVVDTVPSELSQSHRQPGDDLQVMAFAPLQHAPWGVVVGSDAVSAFAGVRRLHLGLALLGVIALASVWTATLVGTRRLVQPIQHLTESAHRIAAGELTVPLQAVGVGEIRVMTTALEAMRRQLLANIEDLADWNETLEARVASQTEALQQQQVLTQQLLRRAIRAQEEERARLTHELHDQIGQMLTAVELSLARLARALPAEAIAARERTEQARVLTERTLADLRRIIAALRPGVLDQLGLVPALGWMADHTLRPLGLNVTIEANGRQARLPGEIETILFRIAQEAMSNVARHSQANHLAVHLLHEPGQVIMILADDGQGCDLDTLRPSPDHSRGLGLAGMQERASLAGGQVLVESAPGRGTTVRVQIPLPTATDDEAAAVELPEPAAQLWPAIPDLVRPEMI